MDNFNDIMHSFDFEKVRKTMQLLDWKWFGVGIPEVYHLQSTADKLLHEVMRNMASSNEAFCSTGGLKASGHRVGDITYLSLEFIVTEWISPAA